MTSPRLDNGDKKHDKKSESPTICRKNLVKALEETIKRYDSKKGRFRTSISLLKYSNTLKKCIEFKNDLETNMASDTSLSEKDVNRLDEITSGYSDKKNATGGAIDYLKSFPLIEHFTVFHLISLWAILKYHRLNTHPNLQLLCKQSSQIDTTEAGISHIKNNLPRVTRPNDALTPLYFSSGLHSIFRDLYDTTDDLRDTYRWIADNCSEKISLSSTIKIENLMKSYRIHGMKKEGSIHTNRSDRCLLDTKQITFVFRHYIDMLEDVTNEMDIVSQDNRRKYFYQFGDIAAKSLFLLAARTAPKAQRTDPTSNNLYHFFQRCPHLITHIAGYIPPKRKVLAFPLYKEIKADTPRDERWESLLSNQSSRDFIPGEKNVAEFDACASEMKSLFDLFETAGIHPTDINTIGKYLNANPEKIGNVISLLYYFKNSYYKNHRLQFVRKEHPRFDNESVYFIFQIYIDKLENTVNQIKPLEKSEHYKFFEPVHTAVRASKATKKACENNKEINQTPASFQ